MESVKNVVLERVERGKSGVESWGTWQAWSIWFAGIQAKFDYFEKDNVVPFPGMQANLVEYTVEQDGRFTNYRIKKIVPATLTDPVSINRDIVNPDPVQPSSPVVPVVIDYEKAKRLTMCTSYAKDIMVQLLLGGGYEKESFSAIIDLVAKGGKLLADKIGDIGDDKPKEAVTTTPLQPALVVKLADPNNNAVTPGMVSQANNALVEQLPVPETGISRPSTSREVKTVTIPIADDVPF